MRTVRDTTIAGDIIHRLVKCPSGKHGGKRKNKLNITSDKVKKNNFRLAMFRLWMLICNNFSSKDGHYSLTYAVAVDRERAAKDRKNFIDRLKRKYKKLGMELKYIVVTEYKNHRIHHHFIINSLDVEMIQRVWGKGAVHITPLYEEGDYHNLAEYLIKETEKTFREKDSIHKQRYSHSKNLIMPVTKREEVSAKAFSQDPKPTKGYYIPKDRVRQFEHPVTGLMHLEYIEVALKTPKCKTWPKGKRVEHKERYKVNYIEEQERIL